MRKRNLKFISNAFFTFFAITGLAVSAIANSDDDKSGPELPAGCGQIEVPAGNKNSFHTFAVGVQIYRWSGTGWDFVAPSAKLFADSGFRGFIGDHYAGPTWESSSGSTVVARRVDGCTPEPTAIPWLLLQAVTSNGAGIFAKTTFIQRVNTIGGLAPAAPGRYPGFEQKVPYLAEYYFYKADN